MRIIGIDYGRKRTGLAVTDPKQIIVQGLATVDTVQLRDYLKQYIARESVEKIVIGYPTHKDGNPTDLVPAIQNLAGWLRRQFKHIAVDFQDEFLSSEQARSYIAKSGVSRKKRSDKGLLDKMSAVVILQDYLQHF